MKILKFLHHLQVLAGIKLPPNFWFLAKDSLICLYSHLLNNLMISWANSILMSFANVTQSKQKPFVRIVTAQPMTKEKIMSWCFVRHLQFWPIKTPISFVISFFNIHQFVTIQISWPIWWQTGPVQFKCPL